MFSTQIHSILKADPHARRTFIGVFSANEIGRIRSRKKKYGLIVNTDTSDLPGRHWQSIFVDHNRTCHFFCSLGEKPNHFIENFINKFPRVKMNKQKPQKPDAITCGGYCIFVQSMMARGYTFETICNVFNQITHDDQFIVNYLDTSHGFSALKQAPPTFSHSIKTGAGALLKSSAHQLSHRSTPFPSNRPILFLFNRSLAMSFETFCRECYIHFPDPSFKGQHILLHHKGIPPPPPAIPETMFFLMHSTNPAVKARTCPFCFLHFDSQSRCAGHIKSKHPLPPVTLATHPTTAAVLQQWELFAEAVYPGYLRVMHNTSCMQPQQPQQPGQQPRQQPSRMSWTPTPTEDSEDTEFELLDFQSASRK
ncbi:hypothetical protein GCK72_004569 [Caenorhabditis remanei]|uniref:Uncharacterized protein n=1 Tax=Caenorhabditis remanei TaxID=31234 RepID=A0A6A5H9Z1_CAERE|nr:hypothetical protein GCK72_004569 [Caenorhabditis remanei]KAF1764620.1 hypothetical protein GCK72_004569 [Caenorhabditis remanei]